jgi:MFS family permease
MTAKTPEIKVYGYRWVILLVFMFINLMMQVFWIAYAPITGEAATEFGVSDLQVGLLAMIFMYIYVPLSLPASWAIDTWGLRKSVGVGAILMGICGLLRGIYADNYGVVLALTIGIAIAQPLMLNATTKLAAVWFPLEERATVIGLGSVAPFLGIVIGQMVTPQLVISLGFSQAHLIYGIVGAVSALLFLIFAREAPPTPAGYEERVLMLDGLKHMFKLTDFYVLALAFFVIGAIFNGVSTWVEVIVRPKGLSITQAGMIGGLLLIGGILGVFILPPISDRTHKRKPVFLIGLVLAIPFLIGLAYLDDYVPLMVTIFLLGLFMMGVQPVASQYATEKMYPTPEATSAGLLMLINQLSVVAITAMGWSNEQSGSFRPSLLVLTGAMVITALLLSRLSESKMMEKESAVMEEAIPTG